MEVRKAKPVTTLSTLAIVIEGYPEVRFTQTGKRVAAFRAVGMTGLSFELWEAPYVDMYAEDSPINLLTSVPDYASIEVSGHAYVDTYKTREGVLRKRNRFIVNSWKQAW